MYKQILQNISGVEIWPIMAFLIFMAIFAIAVVWAIRMDKKEVVHMSNLPLEDSLKSPAGSKKSADIS